MNDTIEERKEKILELLRNEDYNPMKIKEIMLLFKISNDKRQDLQDALDELENEGKIMTTKKGKYILPEKLDIYLGTFQSNAKGYGFLIFDDEDIQDIYIPSECVNGAMNKDRVLCKVTKKSRNDKKAEGEIIKIVERGIQKIVGTFEQSENFGFVVCDDKKIVQDIFIPKSSTKGAVTGHKVIVEIVKWPKERRNPEGKVVEILGHINDPGVDILAIIYQFGLEIEFPEGVYKEVEKVPAEVSKEGIKNRTDLRDMLMVTIDGEDAKDLDDAVSIEKLPNGNYKLGVHIADVTNYVKEGSALDTEALKRGTSVYLVDRVIPMLPHALSNGICSLNHGVDRLALSCIMEINNRGVVVDHAVVESVINTNERMTYTAVKKILEEKDEETIEKYKYLVKFFEQMQDLAKILREKRIKRGALDFDTEETKMILDKKGKPIEIKPYDRNVATRIIEEFMLVCNETIAEDYSWEGVPFVYRSHEEPDSEKLEKLSTFIRNFGYKLKGFTNVHPKELQKILDDIKGTKEENVISRLMLRSMKQARYTATNDGHFGLAAKFYCHFTSPIRRYPDLQIHRIIKENINNGLDEKRLSKLKRLIPEVAQQCSVQERRAEEAERETIKLKKVEYMSDKIGEIYDGIISGITTWGMYVELPNTVEGLVHVTEMDDDYYNYDEKNHVFIGERSKKIYRLGDSVTVQVLKTNLMDRTIDFTLTDKEQL